ncbi:MAG TPA: rhomboid family intramembrane serine protease [Candidatus Kapabacteria bacterium]|nr:rhomboid family intramembrane serine protease [Candidatus Kapabacteria bacterium]
MAYFSDRSGYNRFSMFPPVTKALLIANVAIFILGFVPGGTFEGEAVPLSFMMRLYGALWPLTIELFQPWQYFTYMFLHGGFGHVFINMLVLWMFGKELEELWGSRRFLVFYLACGLGAGLVHSAMTLILDNGGPTVGASGAIMGLMTAFALIYPNREIYIYGIIPLKAKYLLMLYVGMDLFYTILNDPGDTVARTAHLGGALVGFLMLRFGGKMTLGGIFDRKRVQPPQRMAPMPPQERARVIDARFRETEPVRTSAPAPPVMNFGNEQERIDAILDKISHSGYQTLTDEEKAILLEASKRMR